MPKTTNRREFLQLAKVYKPNAKRFTDVSGWFLSEKLDGTRCFWDGGITRGLRTDSVPWASIIHPKNGGRKAKIKPVSTGLWSRYGNPIIAPDWFLNQLPCMLLDGELWAGRGNFQLNRSIVAGDSPDPRFDQIKFAVYGAPPFKQVFRTGEIKNTNFVADFEFDHIKAWVDSNSQIDDFYALDDGLNFEYELHLLNQMLDNGSECPVYLHKQVRLPNNLEDAKALVDDTLNHMVHKGGEGIMLRDPNSVWTPKRVKTLLKYKPFDDDEGTVVGFTSGAKTDKGSKLLGMIGALILDYKGKRLELAGLTNEERQFEARYRDHASEHPGVDMPSHFQGEHFKIGDQVTFVYRELSDDGIPKDARYFRKPDRS